MSLPIDNSAIEAQHAAEHEYGERLMDYATEQSSFEGGGGVTAEHVQWAAAHFLDIENVRKKAEASGLDGRQAASFAIARLQCPREFDAIAEAILTGEQPTAH